MHSQKRFILPGVLLALALSFAQAQLTNIYFISGPEMLCAGQCDTFILQASLPGSGVPLQTVQWGTSAGFTAQGNPVILCFNAPGLYNITAFGTSPNGQNIQAQPYTVIVEACNTPLEIISNADQICAANNMANPPLPPPDDFAFLLPGVSGVQPGQTICMDVTTQNFVQIAGMQFSINYDPARLQLVSVGNFGLPGLSTGNNFGLPIPGGVGLTPPGIITANWLPIDVSGQTLSDGTTLFTLCFIALSGGCPTDVVFSNTTTPIEIIRTNQHVVPFNSRPGRVRFGGTASGGNPNLPGCCEKVCEGATVQYRLSAASAQYPTTWTIRGALSFTIINNGFGVEVVWGSAGQGLVTAISGNNLVQLCVNILAIPEAGFTATPSASGDTLRVCRGQSVAFANTSQGAASLLWQFGDGRSSTELNPVHTWADAGTYRMALVAYNECLCTDTTFLTVVISSTLAPQVTCRGTVCEGTAVTYTTDADCGTFLWTISANGTVTAGGGPADNFITINWNSGPEGIIQLQVENCANADYCPEPNLMPVPVLSESGRIAGPEQVCRSQSARYSITRFGGTEFVWSVSSMGSIQSGQGTHELVVRWAGLLSTQPQWVAVEYDNCYLGCGGRDTIWVNIRPEFFVSGPVESCLNTPQNYTARRNDNGINVACNWEAVASDGAVVWTSGAATATPSVPWNFGPGRFRLIARPASPTDYCTPIAEITVQVLAPPPVLGGIAGAAAICPGLPYTYSANALPGHRINWTFSGNTGANSASGNPVNVTWGAISPYAISAQQVSPQGCASPSLVLDVAALPALAISGAAQVCADETTTYAVSAFEQVSYAWSITPADAGTILQNTDTSAIQVLWHKTGPAMVTLSACGQTVSLPVTVHTRPVPEVLHPAGVCAGDSAVVQTSQSYAAYVWKDANGAQVSTAANPRLPAGYYTVEATDAQGCTGIARFHIESNPAPSVSLSTPDNAGICPGDPPSTLYALNTESGYSFQWFRDGGPIAGATGATYATAQTGVYRVDVTDANGCKAASDTLTVFLFCAPGGGGGFPGGGPPGGGGPPPTPCEPNTLIQFDILPDPDCNVSIFQNISPAFVPGSLLWNFGDPGSGAANISVVENPSHTFSRAGFFRVFLSGTVLNPAPELCYAIRVDTVPVAPAFHFERACVGAAVQFTDASTFLPGEIIATRSWNFGDPASGPNNTSTQTNPTHVFSATGTYTVTLTITAANGCSASLSRPIEVFAGPAVSFDPPAANCSATATPFVAGVGPEAVALRWNFGDPGSGAADSSGLFQPFHRYDTPGTYTVLLEARDIFGCANSFSRDVAVAPNNLSGAIVFSSPICEGDSTLLTASPGGMSWEWSTGDTTETIWVREEGVYSVVVSNANGCLYQPATAAVRVIPAPTTAIRAVRYNEAGQPMEYTYDSLSVCAGEDVFLELLSTAGQTYLWSTGSTGTRIEFSQNRGNQLPVGEHEVIVTVTQTATGCANAAGPYRIVVRPLPDAPLISASPAGVVCEGTPVSFSVSNAQAGVSYSWSSGALGPLWETARPGQYSAVATNEWGCTNRSAPQTILPGPDINLIPSGCHARCNPDTLCFPNVPGITAYQWFLNGTAQGPVSGAAPQIVITQSGDYYLRMTTAQGCTLDSDPLSVELFDGFGSIRGLVFWDRNDNGMFDPMDSLLSGVPFILLNSNVPLDTVLSQSGGQYGFVNILSAGYGLQLDTAALPFGLIADTIRIDTTLVGCDVEVWVNWRLRCLNATTALTLETCPGNTADYNGTPLAIGTSTDFVFTNAAGCDSIVTVTVTAMPPHTSFLVLQACPGSTVDFNGTALSPGTSTDFTFTNALGCDSIVTVTVNTLSISTSSLALNACPGSTVSYNGTALSPGTSTDFTFTNAAGCDSIVTVTVNTLSISTSSLLLNACPGSTVSYNGTALSPGTSTDFTFTNALGCDSIVTVTVNTLSISTSSLSLNACPGSTVSYNGTALSPGTSTDFTFTNALGCDSIVTVTVAAFPEIQIQIAVEESCPNRPSGRIMASASGQGPFLYGLNGGMMQPAGNFSNLVAGAYAVQVEDINGCEREAPVQLSGLPPLQVMVMNTALPCNADSITVETRVLSGDDGQLRFLWDNGATTPQRSVAMPGEYRLSAINNCDTLIQTFTVRYAGSPDVTPIFVPNAFSPNDDGINDRFKAYASAEVTVQAFELMVFDRWGNVMFSTQNIEEGWNGVFRERQMDPAVFVWWLRATVLHCGRVMALDKKGDVTLVR